jgi:hypothetical protein
LQQAEQDIQLMEIMTDFEKGLMGAFGATFDQAGSLSSRKWLLVHLIGKKVMGQR